MLGKKTYGLLIAVFILGVVCSVSYGAECSGGSCRVSASPTKSAPVIRVARPFRGLFGGRCGRGGCR